MKLCVHCGQPNHRPNAETCSPRCYQAHKVKTVAKQCAVCDTEFFSRGKTCSKEHAEELKRRTNREKFGVDWAIQSSVAKEKRVATNLERFGAEHHLQTEASLAKLRNTNRERYGKDYALQSDVVKAKIAETNLERYGVENPFASKEIQERIKEKNLKTYGVPYPSQIESVREKMIATNLERYGVENPFSSDEIKEKIKESNLKTYGVPYPSQAESVKEKMKQTFQKRYGTDWGLESEEIKQAIRLTNLERRGVEYPSQDPEVMRKIRATYENGVATGRISATGRVSLVNQHYAEEIEKRFGVKTKLEIAVGDAASFDIGIVGTNIAIEINPTISHNAQYGFNCLIGRCKDGCEHQGVERTKHQKRALLAKANNVSLIQVYDWDMEACLDFIGRKVKQGFQRISARKLQIKKLDKRTTSLFLKANHIQGSVRGQSHSYGLYLNEELIAVANFGKARFRSKADYEWLRYAVKNETIVYGGPQKLFKAFLEDAKPKSVVSYVDFNHSTGPIFLSSCGFLEGKLTTPSLVWSKGKLAVSNNSLLAQGADRLLGTSYGSREESGMNNRDIMLAEGFLPVYTAGNRVFHWSATDSQ